MRMKCEPRLAIHPRFGVIEAHIEFGVNKVIDFCSAGALNLFPGFRVNRICFFEKAANELSSNNPGAIFFIILILELRFLQ